MKKRKCRVREVEREKQGQVAVLKRVVGGVLIGKVKLKYDFSGVSHPAGNLRKACFQLGQSWGGGCPIPTQAWIGIFFLRVSLSL